MYNARDEARGERFPSLQSMEAAPVRSRQHKNKFQSLHRHLMTLRAYSLCDVVPFSFFHVNSPSFQVECSE